MPEFGGAFFASCPLHDCYQPVLCGRAKNCLRLPGYLLAGPNERPLNELSMSEMRFALDLMFGVAWVNDAGIECELST